MVVQEGRISYVMRKGVVEGIAGLRKHDHLIDKPHFPELYQHGKEVVGQEIYDLLEEA